MFKRQKTEIVTIKRCMDRDKISLFIQKDINISHTFDIG